MGALSEHYLVMNIGLQPLGDTVFYYKTNFKLYKLWTNVVAFALSVLFQYVAASYKKAINSSSYKVI